MENKRGLCIYLNEAKTIRLRTDAYTAWIEERTKVGEPPAGIVRKNEFAWENCTGWYGQLSQLFNSFIDRQIYESNSVTFEELLVKIAEVKALVEEAIPILEATFTERRVAAYKRGARK